ncbi:MAG: site-specific integrase [Desulfobacteraceae bacterium]|nr:site-specific integrase [Desulfobacteraceae bacterium]MBC2752570.1 site-specific integrase [Desulfobacteraceae bacterium]
MGSLYRRGNVWWIKYYRNGNAYRESSKSTKKMVAKKLLDRREGNISQGKLPGIHFEKVNFDQLAEDFLRDYRINHKKSIKRAERSVAKLKEAFEGYRVPAISTQKISEFVETRMQEKAANATINRELAALKRMLNLGKNQSPPLVDRVPYIPMLKENNARKGFFEHGEFLAVREVAPEYLKDFITFAYKTGWRVSEIAKLTWSQVDRKQGIVRLEVGETKNDDGRTIYVDTEVKAILQSRWDNRRAPLPYVFLNRFGNDRVKRFDKTWKKACKDAKIGLRHFHDFRRTAVRNMVRSGIPERVAMMISGHKTRSVFDRYNIVNDSDLRAAAEKQEKYFDSISGTISGTIHQIDEKIKSQKAL